MTNVIDSIPWIEKYRPKKLNEMVQTPNLIDLFKNSIGSKEMPHYLFFGMPGSGKTSCILAMGREIFKEYFPSRVIEFNASDDRGINAVRGLITNEAKKFVTEVVSSDGTIIPAYKIIILDEADSMTDEAQDALRVIIEQYSSVTRFCFICNYISKITDAIKSRCSAVYFKKLEKNCMVQKLKEISEKESMDFPEKIYDAIIDVSNDDMRKAIMLLQNLKYLHDYRKSANKKICDMSITELEYLSLLDINSKSSVDITKRDIYHIAAFIPMKDAHKIINKILTLKNILELSNMSKKIIATGYPIDNIIVQLNKAILESEVLVDIEKALIIKYTGNIFYKMKNCANEYIQLMDYFCCVHGIKNKNPAYCK